MSYILVYNELGKNRFNYISSTEREKLLDIMFELKKKNKTIQFTIIEK